MAKLKYSIILDTETYGLFPDNIVFDIAWAVCTKHNIVKTENFLVKETYDSGKLLNLPFYGEAKTRKYSDMVSTGTKIQNWTDILKTLWSDLKEYSINSVYAYNSEFDCKAIEKTNQIIRKRPFSLFNAENCEVFDLWTIWCNAYQKHKGFWNFCKNNGFFTEKGNIRTSAEIALRFILEDTEYCEEHTALQDVLDEFKIFQKIHKMKKKRNMRAISMPFKLFDEMKHSYNFELANFRQPSYMFTREELSDMRTKTSRGF